VGADGGEWEQERERAERMATALGKLPAVQREAVVLFELEGFSIEEIAAIQRVTASAVKSRLSRGRDRLRRVYARWGIHPERRSGPAGSELSPALEVISRKESQ
jgi:RNA polymerase sigma-70 factor (ECF subfamily)